MGYTRIDKIYNASRYAEVEWHGKPITLDQLKLSLYLATRTSNPREIEKLVEDSLKDYSPLCKHQFYKQGVNVYQPTPNRPKTISVLIGEASERHQKGD